LRIASVPITVDAPPLEDPAIVSYAVTPTESEALAYTVAEAAGQVTLRFKLKLTFQNTVTVTSFDTWAVHDTLPIPAAPF
jgi:hypothetical protein